MHGDDDQMVPYEPTALRTAPLLKHGTLKTYRGLSHGMCTCTTHPEMINADLLAFNGSTRMRRSLASDQGWQRPNVPPTTPRSNSPLFFNRSTASRPRCAAVVQFAKTTRSTCTMSLLMNESGAERCSLRRRAPSRPILKSSAVIANGTAPF